VDVGFTEHFLKVTETCCKGLYMHICILSGIEFHEMYCQVCNFIVNYSVLGCGTGFMCGSLLQSVSLLLETFTGNGMGYCDHVCGLAGWCCVSSVMPLPSES
jgi:hypothetical protein